MQRLLEIIGSSFIMAIGELWKNKLRTFLSLFGVTIGVFCIISVLATVNSLETNIQSSLKSLGSNTVYVDKWSWQMSGGNETRWKYAKRPNVQVQELEEIKKRTTYAQNVAFEINSIVNVEYADKTLSGVVLYGITEEFDKIQTIEIQLGRSLSTSDYDRGANTTVIGEEIATNLFGAPEVALGRQLQVNGLKQTIVGIIKKQGSQLIGGWQFDKSILLPYRNARTIINERRSSPLILVKGYPHISTKILKDELTGVMRSIRRLSPTQEDNFGLNDVNDLSGALEQAFASINIGGWAIGILAFIVGIFGVANIMFVTVKERTPQIGLKKALGAKKRVILAEFLLESAFLCIIGGLIGLLLVFLLTKIASAYLDFPFFLSVPIMMLAMVICIVAGILAGIVPASQAAKMDPVVAIRS
jgi:putative ABC transport system permease protein